MKKVSLFKNTEKKEGSSQPDYRMVASYQDDKGEWQNQSVGSFWLNNSDNPNAPKVSGNLSEAREFEGKSYPGYKIVSDGVWLQNSIRRSFYTCRQ
jgi:hypothetical protein